jgi:FKBP-type peptidyl-prolyl cis-trans isomerase
MTVFLFCFLAAKVGAQEVWVLKTQKDKVSYSFGVEVVKNLKRQGIEVDTDLLLKGIRDALSGENLLMTDDEIRKTLVTFQAEVKQKRNKARATLAK